MSHTTPKMLEALQKLKQDARAKVHSGVLRKLREQQLVTDAEEGGLLLTAQGREAIGDDVFVVQQRLESPGKNEDENWKRIASFTRQDAAESYASRLSVVNHALYRVPLPRTGTTILFDFGKRLVEQSGVVTHQPPEVADETDDSETVRFLWRVQRRMSHLYNEGRFARWEWFSNNRYIDRAEAEDAAIAIAAGDTDAYEYRVIGEDIPESPLFVYCGQGRRLDAGLLDALVAAGIIGEEQTYAERRIEAAARLIAAWAYDARTLESLIERLRGLHHG